MKREQKTTETREQYLRAARKYANRKLAEFNKINHHNHDSFVVRDALEATEKRFVDLGTCGVEYIAHRNDTMRDCLGIEYLNTGDTYEKTLTFDYKTGQFRVQSWGDVVERSSQYV